MERPEAKYFCNKCGYVGPNSQHKNCSYFACTSLEYQYIEELERQLAELHEANRTMAEDLVAQQNKRVEYAAEIEELEEKLQAAEAALQHYMTHGISESSYYVIRDALAKIRKVNDE